MESLNFQHTFYPTFLKYFLSSLNFQSRNTPFYTTSLKYFLSSLNFQSRNTPFYTTSLKYFLSSLNFQSRNTPFTTFFYPQYLHQTASTQIYTPIPHNSTKNIIFNIFYHNTLKLWKLFWNAQ